MLIMATFGYLTSKNQLKSLTFNHLTSIKESKKRNLADYFDHIESQVITKSEGITVINAMSDFNRTFKSLSDELMPGSTQVLSKNVKDYYEFEFLPKLNANLLKDAFVDYFLPREDITKYLQYHYISANAFPTGKKQELVHAPTDTSSYSNVHAKYHPIISNYLKQFDFYDIFLVNPEGYIVYTVFKEVDYATNLITGPYAQTNLGKIFRKVNTAPEKGLVELVDFDEYLPSYSAPASFIASPIFKNGKKIGVLIFQMPVNQINKIMTGDKSWEREGQGKTGECYVVGSDMKLRSLPRKFQEDKEGYIEDLYAAELDSQTINRIDSMNTAILLQPVNTQAAKAAIQGETGISTDLNYLGKEVLSSFTTINLLGLNWGIVAEIETYEAFEYSRKLRNLLIIIEVIIIVTLLYVSRNLSKSIANPMIKIKELIQRVADGELPELTVSEGKDEVSEINNALYDLIKSQHEIADFSKNIGEGNFKVSLKPRGEHDILGNALLTMRTSLFETTDASKKRRWRNDGQQQLLAILKNNDAFEDIAFKLISFLAKYVNASIGGIYVAEKEGDDTYLTLESCYAFNREKFVQQKIKAGFGVLGQTFLEGKTTYLNKLPKNYLNISSGLGDSPPRFLVVIPLKHNDKINGIIELATFKELPKYKIEFLEQAADTIATTIANNKTNEQTRQLLETTETRALQMQESEKIMQQYVEELETAKKEFLRKEEELQKEIKILKDQQNQSEDK
ncbi:MAG: hypothetical protein CMO01_11715 [Thalassobius sp.]|nr:hypothetical protein [Thalassovita sp.]